MKKLSYIFLFILIGCGLTPLHKANKEHYEILSEVQVEPIIAEKGHILRNYIETALNPNGLDTTKKFVITINVAHSSEATLVQKDSTISKSDMIVTANYTLKTIDTMQEIKKGKIKVVTQYESNLSAFSSFSQKNRAYDDALKEVARSLKGYIIIALLNKDYISDEDHT